MSTAPRQPPPTLTFRGGGWVIALTMGAVALLLAWALWGVLTGQRPVGDGATLESYGFSLTPLRAERAYLVASGNPRDFLHTLDNPGVIRGADVLEYNQNQRRKYLVTTDRVIGVVVNGQARAYPLAVLNAHEIINDELGGVPIAVTYSPLTDSAVVFDRRVEGIRRAEGPGDPATPPPLFKVSGLLYNSNLVMYDMPGTAGAEGAGAPPHDPSLWSQLGMRAIAGPAAGAGATLTPLPGVNITSWKMWLAAHPETTVILPDPGHKQRYKEFSYARYFLTPRVDYPAAALPEPHPEPTTALAAIQAAQAGAPRTRKSAAVAVTAGGQTQVWTLAELLTMTGGEDGVWRITLGGVPLRVTTQQTPLAVMVELDADAGATVGAGAADVGDAANAVIVVPQLWFAHQAFQAMPPGSPPP